jgi:hypothetical protein
MIMPSTEISAPVVKPTTTHIAHSNILSPSATMLAIAAIPVILAGCGGGGGGDEPAAPPPPSFTITAVTLAVTTSGDPAVVDVDDNLVDLSGKARFALNGGITGLNRPSDPGYKGSAEIYEFTVTADDGAAGDTNLCYVAINPALDRVFPVDDVRVLKIKHLLNRMGFAPTEVDLTRFLNVPYNTMVDMLVDEADYTNTTQSPPDAAVFPANSSNDSAKGDSLNRLSSWWLREMVRTPHPLLEKMALFWHNVLVVSASQVFDPQPMWHYLDTLRRNAVGSYRTMLEDIAKDPAMVMFLDSNSNVKGRPNENWARELLELFTLGEGNVYTEADVVEVAKCFTGWGLDSNDLFLYRQDRHETAAKTVLGVAVNNPEGADQVRLDGEQVLTIVLNRNEVAEFICGKMWDEFIGGTRDAGTITSWASTFRGGSKDYDVKRVLKAIFKHAKFTAAGERGNMARSPLDLHIGIFRSIGVEPNDYSSHHWQAGEEDQRALYPPNVRGWIGGLTWMNAKTLLTRLKHLGWLGWEFYNSNNQKVPLRLQPILETLWFATPVFNTAYVDDAVSVTWDPKGERIRRLLKDPSLHCK